MSFCPVCKYEYRPGMEFCPDDQARLVDRLAEEPVSAVDRDLDEVGVAILASDSPEKLETLKEMLATQGIDSDISTPVSAVDPDFRLLVKDGQAFAAQRLVEDFLRREFPEDRSEGLPSQQPRMSPRKRRILGWIAIYSITFTVFFLGSQVYIISTLLGSGPLQNPQPGLFLALWLPGVIQFFFTIYYLYQILITAETPPQDKIAWMVMVFFLSMITIPLHYYRQIWEPLHPKT